MSTPIRPMDQLRHHPQLYSTSRFGAWCICSCGWRSATYTTITGAHIAFGGHLRAVKA